MMSVEQPQVASLRRNTSRKKEQPAENCTSKEHLKVQVSGFPPYTRVEDLKYVFAPYGRIQVKLFKKYAIITMPDEEAVKDVIMHSKKLFVYASFVTIKPYKEEPAPTKKVDRFVRSKKKISRLQNSAGSRHKKAQQKSYTLTMKTQGIASSGGQICLNGGKTTQAMYSKSVIWNLSRLPGVIIQPQNLGLTGDFNHQLKQMLEAIRLTQNEVLNISLLYVDLETALRTIWPECCAVPFGSITTGLGIKSSDADCFVRLPERLPDAGLVRRAKALLQRHPHVFAELLAITNARTPIVKLFHVPTETTCDVSFKSELGSRNSRLLAFLLNSDARLLPVAVAVKYWAKVHNLSGSGRLSNYALTMLLVFYLQRRSLLPSVQHLQRGLEEMVDGWNTAFADEPLPPSADGASVQELLGGFFEFYADFDFADLTVCPLLGRPIEKATFADVDSLPDAFGRYRDNVKSGACDQIRHTTPICIQDPFQLCHNVGSAVGDRQFVELVNYLKFARTAYRESGADFLKTILLNKPVMPAYGRNKIRAVIHCRELDGIVGDEWKAIIINVIHLLFEDICQTTLDKVEQEQGGGSKQAERYIVTLTKAVWNRKEFNKLYQQDRGTFLEKQKKISEEIINTSTETPNLKVQLAIRFPQHSRLTSVHIEFVDGDKSDFQQFGNFFRLMIKVWFYNLVKPFLPPEAEIGTEDTARKKIERNVGDKSDSTDQLSETLNRNCSVSDTSK